MSYKDQDFKQPDLKTLPTFLRSSSPQVKFHSAFPPFTTKVKVRGVMERAGFDVYRPDKDKNSHNSNNSNSSSPKLHSLPNSSSNKKILERNFTAPSFFGGKKSYSASSLQRNYSDGNQSTPILNSKNENKNKTSSLARNDGVSGDLSSHSRTNITHNSAPSVLNKPLDLTNNISESNISADPPNHPITSNLNKVKISSKNSPDSLNLTPVDSNNEILKSKDRKLPTILTPVSQEIPTFTFENESPTLSDFPKIPVLNEPIDYNSDNEIFNDAHSDLSGNRSSDVDDMESFDKRFNNHSGNNSEVESFDKKFNNHGSNNSEVDSFISIHDGSNDIIEQGKSQFLFATIENNAHNFDNSNIKNDGNETTETNDTFDTENSEKSVDTVIHAKPDSHPIGPRPFSTSSASLLDDDQHHYEMKNEMDEDDYDPLLIEANRDTYQSKHTIKSSSQASTTNTSDLNVRLIDSSDRRNNLQDDLTYGQEPLLEEFQTIIPEQNFLQPESTSIYSPKTITSSSFSALNNEKIGSSIKSGSSMDSFDMKYTKSPKKSTNGEDSPECLTTKALARKSMEEIDDLLTGNNSSLTNHLNNSIIRDDSVQQLYNMKNMLSSPVDDIHNNNNVNNGNTFQNKAFRSSMLSNGTVLSTMQTNDLKIYNLNNSDEDFVLPEMSMIKEGDIEESFINEEEQDESDKNDDEVLQAGFTKMKLNALESPALRHEEIEERTDSNNDMNELINGLDEYRDELKETGNLNDSFDDNDSNGDEFSEDPIKNPHLNLIENNEIIEEKYNEPGTGPCRRCKLDILNKQKSIWSKDHQLTGQWHRDCFSCYSCNIKFSKGQSCYVFEDKPYCEKHFHELNGSLCKICGKGVEGECLQNEVDDVFHMDCLKCTYCDVGIRSDYFMYYGRVLCEYDAEEQMKQIAEFGNTNDKVIKRRTRMMYL